MPKMFPILKQAKGTSNVIAKNSWVYLGISFSPARSRLRIPVGFSITKALIAIKLTKTVYCLG